MDLLRQPQGVFQQTAQAQPDNEQVVRGLLLLAEALMQQKEYPEAEHTLEALAGRAPNAELAWQRQYWLTRLQLEDQRPEAALQSVVALAALATATDSRDLQAETTALHANILQLLQQNELAVRTWEKNLTDGFPPERQRQALLKIIELSVAQNQTAQALHWLEIFLQKHPQDPALDTIRLSLGELHLKEYYALLVPERAGPEKPSAATNLLQQARAQFDQLVADFPQSRLVGKAHLDRGLVFWEEGKLAECEAACKEATERLPLSEDQAVARFKMADAQYRLNNFSGAITNYQRVLDDFASLPRVKSTLFDQSLYQIVRAAIELGDLAGATAAVDKILAWYPESFFSDRSLLLTGQALNRQGRPAGARLLFVDFLRRFPDSPLAPEVHLAIARTYVQEQDWPAALGKFDDWVARFAGHSSRPQAEFDRAWVNWKAGWPTNALALFIQFTNQFPTHALAPLAQNWMADHYWGIGDFQNAEKNYQLLYQNTNWPTSNLTYEARMMAARSAIGRQGYQEAEKYFKDLINDDKCPPNLVVEALYALGDTLTEAPAADPAKPLDKFAEAINAFSVILQKYPTNRIAHLALGRIANCHFQLAAHDPKRYDNALEAYRKILASELPPADVRTRSEAEVGLGLVYEKQAALKPPPEQAALWKLALDHCLNVVYGNNLKDGETPDRFWVNRAGQEAARMAEGQQQWEAAARLYRRLMELFPPLRPALEKKWKAAQEHLDAGQK